MASLFFWTLIIVIVVYGYKCYNKASTDAQLHRMLGRTNQAIKLEGASKNIVYWTLGIVLGLLVLYFK